MVDVPHKLDYATPRRATDLPSATRIVGAIFGFGFGLFTLLWFFAALGQFQNGDSSDGYAFSLVVALSAIGTILCLGVAMIERQGVCDAIGMVVAGVGGTVLLTFTSFFVVGEMVRSPQEWPILIILLVPFGGAGAGGLWVAVRAGGRLFRR